MRVRTAVGIGIAFVTVKAALTAVALSAGVAAPERRWPPDSWHIELGPFAEWLAAFVAAGAAAVALWIATRDRLDRTAERHNEEKTHARLVRLNVESETSRPVISVKVRNFGPLPIIDVRFVDATWRGHPEARWKLLEAFWQPRDLPRNSDHRPILMPSQGGEDTVSTLVEFAVSFRDPAEDSPLVPVAKHFPASGLSQYVKTDVSEVVAKIRFTTANGVRWEAPTQGAGAGEPARLS
jgi:hypothetical protein